MTIIEAIKERHSVRQYKEIPVKTESKEILEKLVSECNAESGLNFQLICNDSECFNTFLAHYGKFKNANNYIALVGKKSMNNLDQLCGYYGQKIVLTAQTLGLNTCWVAGTFGRKKCKAVLNADEKIVCVISLGYGESCGVPHKSKPEEKLCNIPESQRPDWFKKGLEAAILAPTALNQQKFFVSLEGENPVITTKGGAMTQLDLGIVKFNFEAASGHKCN
ncbi:MAG: nitroreductase family protein [Treponema sp.]|uniref:nitroreductase family protein n=1 Tax=Treponema sp. TaxID=166 RepID=UPI001B52E5A4|nr:nitroreductase family protein [Treponema sp.]MBP5403383.1 nitroreductase family protein [Treponema sp.]MBR5933504.1 nitroreductase family protein [Treponema sp.]